MNLSRVSNADMSSSPLPPHDDPHHDDLKSAARQQQFLEVISPDEATSRFHRHLKLETLGVEQVPLAAALGRVLAEDVVSPVDVSGFDRSNVDGFALRAADTFGAMEEAPRQVRLNSEVLSPGVEPQQLVQQQTATTIATGGMVPRGADAVIMVEETDLVEGDEFQGNWPSLSKGLSSSDESTASEGDRPLKRGDQSPARFPLALEIRRAVSPGANITFAGTDIASGETILRAGQLLTSREIGVLAAMGLDHAPVFRRPRVAIVSTGDEIVPPGGPCLPGSVYDSNAAILSAAVLELGAEPVSLGVVADDQQRLATMLDEALTCDVVVLSGGTSKGAGDLSYRVVSSRLKPPGIVAHGVSLKPGKPVCLAVSQGKPVVILPGFPTSAIFTFHEFVAPVIRALGGRRHKARHTLPARLPMRVNSERGRTEFLLVGLVHADEGLAAYPLGKGSGSVTTFSCADGFITIGQQTEIVEAGSTVEVQLLGDELEPADLVIIGSHCVGLDLLVGELGRRGFSAKTMHVGSSGGLAAARRGECDVAGIHLLDADSGEYNRPFLTAELDLIPGYRRMQSLLFREGDARFAGKTLQEAISAAVGDADCAMINRNAGSGTRIIIDRLLGGEWPGLELDGWPGLVSLRSPGTTPIPPPGYAVQAKSHNAVATAIVQGRADWGIAIDTVARMYGLASIPVQEEHYDFAVPKNRWDRPAVTALRELLEDETIRQRLRELGFRM